MIANIKDLPGDVLNQVNNSNSYNSKGVGQANKYRKQRCEQINAYCQKCTLDDESIFNVL